MSETAIQVVIFSDIHGNPSALNAVLHDIEQHGAMDAYWVLGDFCAIGYDPAGVLDRLAQLKNAVFIRGNADRYVVTGDRPQPTMDDVRKDIELLPLFAEVTSSFTWTQGYLAGRGWMDWLAKLPLEHRLTLPDGTRVLLVHAEPGADDTQGLHPGLTDEELSSILTGCEADLVCVGHFHKPMNRTVQGVRVINPGPVNNPVGGGDLRPSYALLHVDESGYTLTFHKVDYDYGIAIAATDQCGIPGAGYIKRLLNGQIRPSWMDAWDGVAHTPIFESRRFEQPVSPLNINGALLFSERERWRWHQSDLDLEISYYSVDSLPNLAYVTSVRGIVIRSGEVLVVTNQDRTQHIIPGGRIEKDEALLNTLHREIREETSWSIGSLRLLAVMHFRHLTPCPPDYPYPYPEFLQVIYAAEALEQQPDSKLEGDYEQESHFVPFDEIATFPISDGQKALLGRLRAAM